MSFTPPPDLIDKASAVHREVFGDDPTAIVRVDEWREKLARFLELIGPDVAQAVANQLASLSPTKPAL